MTSELSSSSPRSDPTRSRGTLHHLSIVIGVAAIIATLFTAWTEPGLIPGSLAERFNSALEPLEVTQVPGYITPTPRPLPHIGIVAGHSGNDPGAVCQEELGGVREVDVNLDIAERVRANLVAEGYEVDLLTEFDPLLNGYRALALVSIHADSCDYVNDEATGFKVAAALSTQYPERAQRLTTCLINRYANVTGLKYHTHSITPDMTSYHAFSEIHSDTPAAIVEVGFLNLDWEFLTKNPDVAARAVTDGILCYVRNEDITTQPESQP